MDPEDIALLAQLTGRGSPAAEPPTLTDTQMVAEALKQYIAANPRPDMPSGLVTDPEAQRTAQLHAQAMEAYNRRRDLEQAGPGSVGYPPGGAADPPPAKSADLVALGSTASQGLGVPQAHPPGVQLLSNTMAAADLTLRPSFLRPPPTPQPPSAQTQAAARDELMRRGLTPNADYIDPENDALANLARGRVAPSEEYSPPLNVAPGASNNPRPPLPELVIGQRGYKPMAGDENTLARLIFAEGGPVEDLPAVGWSIVNRVGLPEFGKTLNEVRDQKNAFASVAKGGSPQYRLTENPSEMDPKSAEKWQRAQETAHGITNGWISDPTSGGQFFFSSNHYNGDPRTAPGDYPNMLPNLNASPYQGHADTSGHKSYFFIENPKKKMR